MVSSKKIKDFFYVVVWRRTLLHAFGSFFYGIGFAVRKIARIPGWIWEAVRLGWDDAA